ncbi:unnamed protein product [Ectocarpus sp. 6 AP-2014]
MLFFPFSSYHIPKLCGGLCVLARRCLLSTWLRAEHGRESNCSRGMDHVCAPFDASLIMPRYISSGAHQQESSVLKLYFALVTRSVIVHPWAEISFVSPPPLVPARPKYVLISCTRTASWLACLLCAISPAHSHLPP